MEEIMARKDKIVTPSVTEKLQIIGYNVADWDDSQTTSKLNFDIIEALSKSSKQKNGKEGYPDRIYFDKENKLLILVEEKPTMKEHNLEEVDSASSSIIDDEEYEFESNYAENHLSKLKNSYQNWWVDGDRDDIYLVAKFGDVTEVNGIVITQPRSDIKTLEGVDISASPDGTTYYPQGSYTRSSYKQKIYLKFKKPIKVKKIKFTNFKKHNDRYIDIYRVQFF